MTPELKARFQELVDRNDDIFARSMRDLGEYRGDVGPAHIELAHQHPIHLSAPALAQRGEVCGHGCSLQ
jgi:hypothetical protein